MRDFKISDKVREIKPDLFEPRAVLDIVDIRMTRGDLQVGVVLKGTRKIKPNDIIYDDYKKFKKV